MAAMERDAVRAVFGCGLVVVVLVVGCPGTGQARGHEVRGGHRRSTTERAPQKRPPRDRTPAAVALLPVLRSWGLLRGEVRHVLLDVPVLLMASLPGRSPAEGRPEG
jgi:hypothetical protein